MSIIQSDGIMQNTQHQHLTLPEVLYRLRVRKTTLYKLIAIGKLPRGFHVAPKKGRTFWRAADIDAYLIACQK